MPKKQSFSWSIVVIIGLFLALTMAPHLSLAASPTATFNGWIQWVVNLFNHNQSTSTTSININKLNQNTIAVPTPPTRSISTSSNQTTIKPVTQVIQTIVQGNGGVSENELNQRLVTLQNYFLNLISNIKSTSSPTIVNQYFSGGGSIGNFNGPSNADIQNLQNQINNLQLGGGGVNPFNQSLNTTDSPTFSGLTLTGGLTGTTGVFNSLTQNGNFVCDSSGNCGSGTFSTSSVRGVLSATTPLSYNSSTGVFSVAAGFNVPLTASTTDWQNFFLTPSSRITPGTGLSWIGNVLSNSGVTSIGGLTGNVATSSLGLVNSVFGRTGTVTAQSGDYTTSQVTEGSNLYFTNGRVDSRFAVDLAATTTNALPEGSNNLYYTDARARAALSSSATGLTYTSGTGVFSLTSGYNIPLTASTTNWNNFFNTPSTQISAGTGLSWTGNTLSNTGVLSIGGLTGTVATSSLGLQVAGNYITALTGDATASGPGSVALTLATVNSNVGTFRSVTVNGKGLVTAATNPTTFAGYGISDTSANLAAALTDETGSGAAVFGTSPTFTTNILTPLIKGTSNNTNSAIDLNNRNLLDSGGHAVVQWDTYALDNASLHDVLVWSSGDLADSAGNEAENWFNRTLYNGSGSEVLYWGGTTGVGIGSSTPFAKLTVKGTGTGAGLAFQTTDSSDNPKFTILDNGKVGIGTTSPIATLSVKGTGGTNPFVVSSSTDAQLLTLLQNGNLGIGSSTPGVKLGVAGDINLTGALRANGNAGTNGFLLQSTGSGLQWVATSSLGISGGGSPAGSNGAVQFNLNGSFGADSLFNWSTSTQILTIGGQPSGNQSGVTIAANGGIVTSQSLTIVGYNANQEESFRPATLTFGGALGNGCSGCSYPDFSSDGITWGSANIGLGFGDDSLNIVNDGLAVNIGDPNSGVGISVMNTAGDHSSDSINLTVPGFGLSSSPAFTVDSNGHLFAPLLEAAFINSGGFGGTPSAASALCWQDGSGNSELTVNFGSGDCNVSSERFKHDIVTSTAGLDELMALRPVTFISNGDPTNSQQLGFIAEEAAQVDPRLVFDNKEGQIQGFRYENFTAVLAKAIQDQQAEIQALQLSLPSTSSSQTIINNLISTVSSGSMAGGISIWLSSLQTEMLNGITYLSQLFTKQLTIGSPEHRNGITLYDQATGEPYCVVVKNGALLSNAGECSDIIVSINTGGSSSGGSTGTSTASTTPPLDDGGTATTTASSTPVEPPMPPTPEPITTDSSSTSNQDSTDTSSTSSN